MAEDMIVYLDGTDIKEVASAARRLDATAFYAGQMSLEDARWNKTTYEYLMNLQKRI